MRRFPRVKSGDALTPRHLNIVYAELERLNKLQVVAPLVMTNGPDGVTIGPGNLSALDKRLVYTQSGGIPARSGSLLGSAWVDVVTRPSGTTLDNTGNGSIIAYNAYGAAFSGSKYVWCVEWQGSLFALTQEC